MGRSLAGGGCGGKNSENEELRTQLACEGGEVPVEQFAVPAALNPGEQVDDHVAGFGDLAPASGVVEVAGEVGEGGESAAGFDEALDDICGFGGFVGVPAIGDGLGNAAGFDDGEFGGEPSLESVDGAADFGEGHGVTPTGKLFAWMNRMDKIGYANGIVRILSKILSFPLISSNLSRAWSGWWGMNGR